METVERIYGGRARFQRRTSWYQVQGLGGGWGGDRTSCVFLTNLSAAASPHLRQEDYLIFTKPAGRRKGCVSYGYNVDEPWHGRFGETAMASLLLSCSTAYTCTGKPCKYLWTMTDRERSLLAQLLGTPVVQGGVWSGCTDPRQRATARQGTMSILRNVDSGDAARKSGRSRLMMIMSHAGRCRQSWAPSGRVPRKPGVRRVMILSASSLSMKKRWFACGPQTTRSTTRRLPRGSLPRQPPTDMHVLLKYSQVTVPSPSHSHSHTGSGDARKGGWMHSVAGACAKKSSARAKIARRDSNLAGWCVKKGREG